MHVGKRFPFLQVIRWTRADILILVAIATAAVVIYDVLQWRWVALPWLPVALLGTVVSFMIGFKNNASYDRAWEARKIWGAIVNTSRTWGVFIKNLIPSHTANLDIESEKVKFVMRHLAWITALRFSLREPRSWEAVNAKENEVYRNKWFRVPELVGDLRTELNRYLPSEEVDHVMQQANKSAALLALQSQAIARLFDKGLVDTFRHVELQRLIAALYDQQGGCERIKNYPYPRQYATANLYFIRIFVALIPFGLLKEFDALGEHLIWLTIPFSAMVSWVFTTLEKIGESTENPFQSGANDVPITAISRTIEIDLRQLFQLEPIPAPHAAENNILT
jgi:putative membrane protein